MRFQAILSAILLLGTSGSFRPYPRLPDGPSLGMQRPIAWAGHSHNDFERERPLDDALSNGFASVEADVWLEGREVVISHLGLVSQGSLRELYLDPLQRRVKRMGSVYGDGKPFLLWIDIKDSRPALVRTLHTLLRRYNMLTRVEGSQIHEGMVTAILTGSPAAKASYEDARQYPARFAFSDSHHVEAEDPQTRGPAEPWQWYSLNWFNYLNWDGEGAPSTSELAKLKELVARVHAKGRKLRFWGAPETPAVWRASALAGVDLIGTDDLGGVRNELSVIAVVGVGAGPRN